VSPVCCRLFRGFFAEGAPSPDFSCVFEFPAGASSTPASSAERLVPPSSMLLVRGSRLLGSGGSGIRWIRIPDPPDPGTSGTKFAEDFGEWGFEGTHVVGLRSAASVRRDGRGTFALSP